MPLAYITKLLDDGFVQLFTEKSEDSSSSRLPAGDVVKVDPSDPENDQDWVFVSRKTKPSSKGWIQLKFLREPEPGDEIRFPMEITPFVRSCGRAELAAVQTGNETATPVSADYLLAWAHIESADGDEPFSNPEPDFENSDAEGPFRLTGKDWKSYQTAAKKTGIDISGFERLIPNSQVSGAAFKALREADEFSKLAIPGDEPVDGPFVPSYLNVLHSHMLGAKAAHHFQKLKNENSGSQSVSDALDAVVSAQVRNTLLKNRGRFLKEGDEPVTVDMFFELTSQALADGFKKALVAIRDHADFLLPPRNDFKDGAPWMKIAEREMKIWKEQNLSEKSGDGLKKVIEYFKAVKFDTTKNQPWCGAFVGYCLQEADPSFASTIVKSGATAAKWLNWGNIGMRQFDLRDIPLGSIVVTHPMFDGTSGHVGFAAGKVTGTDKIVVLGGNQSDSVTLKHIHKNKVRQIRWHNALNQPAGNIGTETDPKLEALLSLIASKESNGNYNAYFGKAGNTNQPKFTAMTVQEVRAWQEHFVKVLKKKSSAVGKYQIIRNTLDAVRERLGLSGSELFDKNMQDRMAINLLEVRRLNDFLNGTIDVTKFGNLLAMEWASFPVLSRIKNTKGRFVNRGQSFYAGDGLNKAHVMPEQVEDALRQLTA